jgi:hypothetical protein
MFGLLAIDVATGGNGSSSTAGAIERIMGDGPARYLLIGLCIGLLALVAWKVLQAIAGDPVEGSEATDRAKYVGKAAVYTGALVAAIAVLIANWSSGAASAGGASAGSGSGGDTKKQATATVLGWPGGQVLVIAAGFGIVGFGLYELYRHTIEADFMQRLDLGGRPESAEHTVEMTGRAGYGASASTTVVVGLFLVIAGVNHDPSEATGLSGALQELGDTTWGTWLLWAIGIGLLGYAAFSLVEAALRRTT